MESAEFGTRGQRRELSAPARLALYAAALLLTFGGSFAIAAAVTSEPVVTNGSDTGHHPPHESSPGDGHGTGAGDDHN